MTGTCHSLIKCILMCNVICVWEVTSLLLMEHILMCDEIVVFWEIALFCYLYEIQCIIRKWNFSYVFYILINKYMSLIYICLVGYSFVLHYLSFIACNCILLFVNPKFEVEMQYPTLDLGGLLTESIWLMPFTISDGQRGESTAR